MYVIPSFETALRALLRMRFALFYAGPGPLIENVGSSTFSTP